MGHGERERRRGKESGGAPSSLPNQTLNFVGVVCGLYTEDGCHPYLSIMSVLLCNGRTDNMWGACGDKVNIVPTS